VHDREQLTFKVRHGHGSATTDGTYDLKLYLFIPRNVGLNSTNYPTADFYSDLTTFLRLDLPERSLVDLRTHGRSPLRGLDQHLARIARGDLAAERVAVAVKLFGHTFTEAVRREVTQLRQRIVAAPAGTTWRAKVLHDLSEIVSHARSSLARLREAKRKFSPYRRVAPRVWEVFHQTDEYASLYLDGELAELAEFVGTRAELYDGSGWIGHVLQVLASCAAVEAAYRREHGFVNLEPGAAGREYFLYRQSQLKKAVHQALWVETKRLARDQYMRNASGMMAASLAATWAVIAQLPQRIKSLSSTAQALMFALPIVVYVAKDRIKELTKEALLRRMRSFDQETALASSYLAEAGLESVSGTLSEKVKFLSLDTTPAKVLAVRRRGRWVAGAEIRNEAVLLYSRRLQVTTPLKTIKSGEDFALRQIIRLNLRHFMTRLDERGQTVRHYEPATGGFMSRELAKVYHLNLVAEFGTPDGPKRLQRWRVVFSKEGIERVEELG
jgi:hypothetical protein